ncbi:hypothetical protein DFH29DRAFT_1002302 [Suillus ampliporus]|nr:hypothetical protein DFH29DRAFT_1002302 [Suillus ampliporus]
MRTPSSDKELITIALIILTTLKTQAEEDYPYSSSHSYPHPPLSGKWYAYGSQDSPVELVYIAPSYICTDGGDADRVADVIMAEPYHKSLKPGQFFDSPLVASPSPEEDAPIKEEVTCAYFEQHECAAPEVQGLESVLRYAHGGARNVSVMQKLDWPEVVVVLRRNWVSLKWS